MVAFRHLAPGALVTGLVVSSGCSLALQSDAEQCTVDADCASRGGDFAGTICVASVCQAKPVPVDPKWGCVGKVPAPVAGTMDTIKLQLVDVITGMAPKKVTVKLCNKYDPACAAPLGTPVPDAMGFISTTLPAEVEAYLEVTSADGTYMPALAFLDHVAADKNPDIELVAPDVAQGIATAAGVTLDLTKGVILARTADCTHARTAGVSDTIFPTDAETRFYLINNAATPSATQTDSAGNSGFVNVDPGNVTITGTEGPTGPEFGKATTLVRAGYITYQMLRPTATL